MTAPPSPPKGLRDLLPDEAFELRSIEEAVRQVLEVHGYDLIATPAFETAAFAEQMASPERGDTRVQFVDPLTGEACALRSDITPQIGRLARTRLAHRPPPYRLFAIGDVIRAHHARSKRDRQHTQVSVECIGGGAHSLSELVELSARCLDAIGITPLVELHLPSLAVDVAARLSDPSAALAALHRRDRSATLRASETLASLIEATAEDSEIEALLTRMHPLAPPLIDDLATVCAALRSRPCPPRLRVDLGEVGGANYYTGVAFSLLAHGPGEPLGGGGRYHAGETHAVGFALDLGRVRRAIGEPRVRPRPSLVVRGVSVHMEALRARGWAVVEAPDGDLDGARAWTRAWGRTALLHADGLEWYDDASDDARATLRDVLGTRGGFST